MATKVTYKDGTSEVLSDSEVDAMPDHISAEVKGLENAPDSLLSQLKNTQQDSSPFGARPESTNTVHPKTVLEAAKQSAKTLIEPVKIAGNYIRENPAKTALALGSFAVPEFSIPAAMGASMVATAVDKLHPFEPSVESEYTSKTGGQNVEDLIGATAAGAAGQYLANRAGAWGNKLGKYNSDMKMFKNDRFEYTANSPELSDAWSATNKAKEQADPNMLHSMWVEYGSHPSMTKDILKAAKEDIAARSNLPRKMSTITDREAREHLDKVISNVDAVNMPNIDITPKNPMQGLVDKVSESSKDALLGGLLGHVIAGPTGAFVGGLGGGFAKAIADKTVKYSPTVAAPVASGLGRIAFPAAVGAIPAGQEYIHRLTTK